MTAKSNISHLPIWKDGATPAERFSEFEAMARQYPDRFGKIVVLYEETLADGRTILRRFSDHCTTNELIGLLGIAKVEIIQDSRTQEPTDVQPAA